MEDGETDSRKTYIQNDSQRAEGGAGLQRSRSPNWRLVQRSGQNGVVQGIEPHTLDKAVTSVHPASSCASGTTPAPAPRLLGGFSDVRAAFGKVPSVHFQPS